MIKLVVFDLDKTIAPHSQRGDIRNHLISLEDKGIRLMFISSKPTTYVSGFVQSLGITEAIIVGENGAEIHFNLNYPVHKTYVYCEHEVDQLATLQVDLLLKYTRDIWFQPNNVNVSAFSRNSRIHSLVKKDIKDFVSTHKNFSYNENLEENSFEIHPSQSDRGAGIRVVMRELGLKPPEVIGIGNTRNDKPLFLEGIHSISWSQSTANHKVLNTSQAINKVNELISEEEKFSLSNIYYFEAYKKA
ncbi:HAD hydrolase family protein (plasmid) [Rossellomorea sp. AcN35-11]|nr:HAD hydrolase family protein [Rossellomorea aquimaris]WJV31791.1 HAD hydrolase family protein [Rossellomorea sp. AcN35-11]